MFVAACGLSQAVVHGLSCPPDLWNLLWPGIKPVSSTLTGRFPGPLGKSQHNCFWEQSSKYLKEEVATYVWVRRSANPLPKSNYKSGQNRQNSHFGALKLTKHMPQSKKQLTWKLLNFELELGEAVLCSCLRLLHLISSQLPRWDSIEDQQIHWWRGLIGFRDADSAHTKQCCW